MALSTNDAIRTRVITEAPINYVVNSTTTSAIQQFDLSLTNIAKTLLIRNNGDFDVYLAFDKTNSSSGLTATTSDFLLKAGEVLNLESTQYERVAYISPDGTTELRITLFGAGGG